MHFIPPRPRSCCAMVARDQLARGIRLLFCFEQFEQVSDDLSSWDGGCWCAASIFV